MRMWRSAVTSMVSLLKGLFGGRWICFRNRGWRACFGDAAGFSGWCHFSPRTCSKVRWHFLDIIGCWGYPCCGGSWWVLTLTMGIFDGQRWVMVFPVPAGISLSDFAGAYLGDGLVGRQGEGDGQVGLTDDPAPQLEPFAASRNSDSCSWRWNRIFVDRSSQYRGISSRMNSVMILGTLLYCSWSQRTRDGLGAGRAIFMALTECGMP